MKKHHQTPIAGDNSQPLYHVVLTTGYNVTHRLDAFAPEKVGVCRDLLPEGGRVPFVKGPYSVGIEGPTFTLYRKDCPLVCGGIGRGCDLTWGQMLSLMRDFDFELQTKPHQGLWLAVIPLPTIHTLKRKETGWMFDFQRHLAAAMLSSSGNKPV